MSQKLRILRKVFFGDLDFDAVESVVDDVGSMAAFCVADSRVLQSIVNTIILSHNVLGYMPLEIF